jgi:hypothetical protein
MKPFVVSFLWCICMNMTVFAQKTIVVDSIYGVGKAQRERFISVNMTPLLVQLIPFNSTNPLISGTYNATYKSYKRDKGFIFSIGATTFGASQQQQNTFFNLRIGWENRKVNYQHWYYAKGMSFLLSVGHLNIIGNNKSEFPDLGLGPHWSFGYEINPFVSIGSEMMLLISIRNLMFLPPTAINITFNLNKK